MSYAGDITPLDSWKLLNENPDAVLVDVRTDAGRNENFVADLIAAGVTPGERPVIFLCRSGNRSIPAAQAATAAGIAPSYNMLEGFEGQLDESGHRGSTGWRADGLPWKQT